MSELAPPILPADYVTGCSVPSSRRGDEYDGYWTAGTGLDTGEQEFVDRIYDAVTTLRQRGDTASTVVLFDIDGTIRPLNDDMYDVRSSECAPARKGFPELLGKLASNYAQEVSVGFLTTHNLPALQEEASRYLEGYKDIADPDMYLSSHRGQYPDIEELERNYHPGPILDSVVCITDPKIIENSEANPEDPSALEFWDPKLSITARLLSEFPNRSIVVVDDLPWVNAIARTPEARAIGVHCPGDYSNMYDLRAVDLETYGYKK